MAHDGKPQPQTLGTGTAAQQGGEPVTRQLAAIADREDQTPRLPAGTDPNRCTAMLAGVAQQVVEGEIEPVERERQSHLPLKAEGGVMPLANQGEPLGQTDRHPLIFESLSRQIVATGLRQLMQAGDTAQQLTHALLGGRGELVEIVAQLLADTGERHDGSTQLVGQHLQCDAPLPQQAPALPAGPPQQQDKAKRAGQRQPLPMQRGTLVEADPPNPLLAGAIDPAIQRHTKPLGQRLPLSCAITAPLPIGKQPDLTRLQQPTLAPQQGVEVVIAELAKQPQLITPLPHMEQSIEPGRRMTCQPAGSAGAAQRIDGVSGKPAGRGRSPVATKRLQQWQPLGRQLILCPTLLLIAIDGLQLAQRVTLPGRMKGVGSNQAPVEPLHLVKGQRMFRNLPGQLARQTIRQRPGQHGIRHAVADQGAEQQDQAHGFNSR